MTKSSLNNFDKDIRLGVRLLKLTQSKKSPNPEQIHETVPKTCAEHLGDMFQCIFMECLEKERIPPIQKHSIVAPVAKCCNPKALKDFRLHS